MESTTRIPVVRLGGNLIVSIQVALDDRIALQLKDDVARMIGDTGARGLLIDVTAVDAIDSYLARIFNEIGRQAALFGTRAILVGLQPAIAITLVEMGMDLDGIETALTLDDGLELLETEPESESDRD